MALKSEQSFVINHNDGNILVSASAGSGKTFVMIERLIRLVLEKKATIKQMLAVTFTESAAFEMKEKLKEAFSKKLGEDTSACEYLSEQMSDISNADICTLHAFCARLIRSYFYLAGVSPDYTICDEAQSATLKTESINKVFRKCYEEKEQWFTLLVDKFSKKRQDKSLKELVIRLFDYSNVYNDSNEFFANTYATLQSNNFASLKKAYKSYLDKLLKVEKEKIYKSLMYFTSLNLKKGVTYIKEVLSIINIIIEGDLYIVKSPVISFPVVSFERNLSDEAKSFKKLATDAVDSVKAILKRYNKHLESEEKDLLKQEQSLNICKDISKLIDMFKNEYEELKREENLLDFSDLEHYAIKILRDEKAGKDISSRYKFVFVDEYQDINEAQEEIITRLSNDNLFMVGDVKQSIYGFRGCKPEIFEQKMENMKANNQTTVKLNYNFRSAPSVIGMVNNIFSYVVKIFICCIIFHIKFTVSNFLNGTSTVLIIFLSLFIRI